MHATRILPRAFAVGTAIWLALSTLIPSSTLGAAPCNLVPQLREVTINQGLGAYPKAVQGKETLVRAYLSLPSCASSSSTIKLTGGTVRVVGGGLDNTVQAPFPVPASPYSLISPYYRSTPPVDSPGDPRFVVPSSYLDPSGSAGYLATFTIKIQYQAFNGQTATNGEVTFTKFPGTTTDISKTVERDTNPLRILVVPAGNAALAYATQYSTAANDQLQVAMQTLSRIFPVKDGTAELTGTTGGVRYTVDPTLIDIGPVLDADGYCLRGSSFDSHIKGPLTTIATEWETQNPNLQIDVAVAVIDPAISSAGNCAQGLAVSGSTYNTSSAGLAAVKLTPGQAGGLLAMEVQHAVGLAAAGRGRVGDSSHSPNTAADAGSNRGYNLRERSFLGDDRTALYYSGSGFTNITTLAEQLDYQFLLCALGGSTSSDCTSPGLVGNDVPAANRFALSGTVAPDGLSASVVEAFTSELPGTPSVLSSPYTLIQIDGVGSTLRTDPVPVLFGGTHHGDGAHDAGVVNVVVPFNLEAERIEFRKDGAVLECDAVTPGFQPCVFLATEIPEITQFEVVAAGEVNYTNDSSIDDEWPSVSPGGGWVAWNTNPSEGSSRVKVAPISDASASVEVTGAPESEFSFQSQSQPAWRPDGDALAFVSNGDIYMVDVDTSGETAVFSNLTLVYDHDDIDNSNPDAEHPSWSPDGTQLAYAGDGAIFVIDAVQDATGTEDQLTFTGDASNPSWSQTSGDDRIAYQREAPIFLATADLVSYVQPGRPAPAAPASHAGAEFTVTSADDVTDGTCNAAHCSLREAITAANALAGTDSIHFAIDSGPQTIQPATALPTISSPVVVDGRTQPGWVNAPIIEIDGQGATFSGLTISAGSSEVTGLVIGGFSTGVQLTTNGGNTILGNYIGTDPTGVFDRGGGGSGVSVSSGGNNTIGGTSSADRNVLAGWGGSGVRLAGAGGNTVLGNFIGTDATGSSPLGNVWAGVDVVSSNNTIGGTAAGAGNVMSANGDASGAGAGIYFGSGSGNSVLGNRIGTDATGTAAIPNTRRGILVQAGGNAIGGTAAGAGNLISGNVGDGVMVAAADTVLQGNLIGVSSSGNAQLANSGFGIQVTSGATGTQIGGTAAGAGNVISGNGGGVVVGSTASGATIQGNLVGLGADGSTAIGNFGNGVQIASTGNNTIGGTAAGARNVIAHNGFDGVVMTGTTANASGNAVAVNEIFANGGLGIDLAGSGVTENDANDADDGPNDLQNFPINLAAVGATTTTVTGELFTNPGTDTYAIDVYANAACDNSTADTAGDFHGEGQRYLGRATLVTNADGFGSFTFPATTNESGKFITVTATDSVGNTSEFSACELAVGDGPSFVVNSTSDSGTAGCTVVECTLREAIVRANAEPNGDGADVITFDIPGTATPDAPHVITVGSALPSIGEAVVIDGSSEPDFSTTTDAPVVQLDGSAATTDPTHGLVLATGGSTIRGLSITSFLGSGIRVESDGNTLEGNYIGLEPDGVTAGPNGVGSPGGYGVIVDEASSNAIGLADGIETLETNRNIISGNDGPGVIITGATSTDNSVENNYIGTNASGTAALPNGVSGVVVDLAEGNSIGGLNAGTGNVISGNAGDGVTIIGDTTSGGTNFIQQNKIGTNAAGTAAVPNEGALPTDGRGVLIVNASNNTIGGVNGVTGAGVGNLISGNATDGVEIQELTAGLVTSNFLTNNRIGVDQAGSGTVPNGGAGVEILGGKGTVIGGLTAGAGNLISGNVGDGVSVAAGTEHGITGNAISENGGLGIDLGADGVAANDEAALDADTGANNLQNFPRVTVAANGTAVSGVLRSAASETYTVELFSSPACDSLEHGEGAEFLGDVEVTTNQYGYGYFTFGADPDDPFGSDEEITATATDSVGNTSEFSRCAVPQVTGTEIWTIDPANPASTEEQLTDDGAQPSWGTQGKVAFERNNNIHTIGSDGTGEEQLTDGGEESMPSLGGVPAFARSVNDIDLGDSMEVFLLMQQATAFVTVEDDNPDDLKLALSYTCPGSPHYPVAVGLPPTSVAAASASWIANYDPSLACPNGVLSAIVMDNWNRVTDRTNTTQITSEEKDPVAAIYIPAVPDTLLQWDALPLHGSGKDDGGELSGSSLRWFVNGPEVTYTSCSATRDHCDIQPPTGGWTPGTLTVTLEAADADGNVHLDEAVITVLADADRDGIPAAIDNLCGSDTNPLDGFADNDGDGTTAQDDYALLGNPCMGGIWGPETLYVPSVGDAVTMTVKLPITGRDLKTVPRSSVGLRLISGEVVNIPNVNWTVDKKGVGVARFDRQVVIQKLVDLGLVGGTVYFTVSGTSTQGWTFDAVDAGEVKPAN